MLSLLLFSGVLGNGVMAIPHAFAATKPPAVATATTTLNTFLAKKAPSVQPFVFPKQPLSPWAQELQKNPPHVLPSTQPVHMVPLHQTLAPATLAQAPGTAAANATPAATIPTQLKSSDGHLAISIPAGAIDASHAVMANGRGAIVGAQFIAPGSVASTIQQSGVTLTVTQSMGQSIDNVNSLGFYQFQISDTQGHALTGVRLLHPITIQYHYALKDIEGLGLDPGKLMLTWPDQFNQAIAAKQPTTGLVVPMQNDAATQTLTAQVNVLGTTASIGTGAPTNQSPPKPLMASVQPNTGQLGYSYPIAVPPGPTGTTPTVQLSYSSQGTNSRYEPTSPADSPGEGWGISMGSISMQNYPSGSAITGSQYFINGVDNVSDRLIPITAGSTTYVTEHVSYLKVQQFTPAGAAQPCFRVWDTSGAYSEYGCTNDSLEYSTDSTGKRTNYSWNLDRVVPVNEGPGTTGRFTAVSYLQDLVVTSGKTTVRDSVIQQITYGSGTSIAGTVDFFYKGATNQSAGGIQFVTAYGNNEGGCVPPQKQPATTLRCDDPVDLSGGLPAPTVMSTYSMQTIKTYVGSDTATPLQPDASYSLTTVDTAYHQCTDARTGIFAWCASGHTLSSITPTVYQNGVAHPLPGVTFTYAVLFNLYIDAAQKVNNKAFGSNNAMFYLTGYHDHATGAGETITYQTAWNNTHGTPNDGSDNRFDPTYCNTHNTCTGPFANPNDQAWTMQVVHTVTTLGADSSNSTGPATTTYAYGMSSWGKVCAADSAGLTTCTGYVWTAPGDNDWQDYYHAEFHGFSWVYIISPAGNLTTQNYGSTEGWGTNENFSGNYTSGQLYETDVYQGPTSDPAKLISKTRNTYAGNNSTPHSCSNASSYPTYQPCEVILTNSTTTQYEQAGASNPNAPWVAHDYTYDDYRGNNNNNLSSYPQAPATGAYHNLQQEVIRSSNAPPVTKKSTFYTTDTTVNGQVYYNVHQVAHSEVDDASGHVWSCQDTSYDEGIASGLPHPAAGWPTTQKMYTNCSDPTTAITTGAGYDGNGNIVASIDGIASTHSGLYSTTGCTLATAPVVLATGWTASRYTSCTTYNPLSGQPSSQSNVFGQATSTTYDAGQGLVPLSSTDSNGQTNSLTYSYDSNGNKTVQTKQPGEPGSYTSQSQVVSTCTDSSTLPCVQENSNNSQYSSAITRTFTDSQGRTVETLAPAADPAHTVVAFTLYNDLTHTVFSSQPFVVASVSSWVDPNAYATTPGTMTTLDAAGRVVSVVDALGKTSTSAYGLGTISGDANTYNTTTSTDANGHVVVTYGDALGRTIYTQQNRGQAGGTLTPVVQTTSQYTVLGNPTSVTVTDLAPQAGQTITSATTTAQYNDLGQQISINDPDRGVHTYSYDADGHVVTDVSGSRTLGFSYDLLGRVGCLQDAAATLDVHGACTSGANPFVINTYDADPSGVSWTGTNYPIGRLTQSQAINYLPAPDNTQGTVTQNVQYDPRGNAITARLTIAATGGSLSFPTLPQYQQALTYNDADQLMRTQTTVGGAAGYTFSQVYDGTTGAKTGLSNTSTGAANLATLSYNTHGQVGSINYLATDGSALATSALSYDGALRPTGATATMQSGNTIYSEGVGYDAIGNVTSKVTTQSAIPGHTSTGGNETQNFCYDEQNRLIWASNNAPVPSAGSGTCGNTTYQGTLGGNYTSSYVYTHLGQLWQGPLNGGGTQEQYLYCDSTHPHQLSNLSPLSSTPTCASKGTVDYTSSYDTWGNVVSQVRAGITRTPVYDGQDHLMHWSSSVNSQQEWYLYDASGSRVLRRSFDGTNTTMTVYAFGLEEHQYAYSGSGTTATNTSNTYYYTLGGQLLGSWDGTSATTTFLLSDALGSIVSSFNNLPNGAAIVLGNQIYGPYGNQRVQQGTMSTSKGFTGQYNDWLTGLDYYNARYYDPAIGQFLSADSVQGNAQGMDPYSYVGGNPETRTDPTGTRMEGPDGQQIWTGSNGKTYENTPTQEATQIGYSQAVVNYYQARIQQYAHYKPTTTAKPKSTVRQVSHHAVSQVTKALSQVAGIAGKLLWEAIDLVFNVSGMMHDVQTMTDSNANWWERGAAFADLSMTLFTDISMLDGEGEAMRAAEIGEELATKGESEVAHIAEGAACSFVASTPVAVAGGKQAIGSLQVGEKVWAYNPSSKTMELQPILHVWINHDNDLVDLTISKPATHDKGSKPTSEVIHTNQKHPFLTVEKGFVLVGQITLGMHLVEAGGLMGVVSGWTVVPGVMTMYNLEVAQDHTFTVGVGMWVVHNCGVGRSGAFRAAKRDAGIPMSQAPDSVESVRMTNRDGSSVLGSDGLPINTREYHFTREDGSEIIIQDHSAGHYQYGGVGDQGPHMNVRPIDNPRTGHVDGTLDHYSWLP